MAIEKAGRIPQKCSLATVSGDHRILVVLRLTTRENSPNFFSHRNADGLGEKLLDIVLSPDLRALPTVNLLGRPIPLENPEIPVEDHDHAPRRLDDSAIPQLDLLVLSLGALSAGDVETGPRDSDRATFVVAIENPATVECPAVLPRTHFESVFDFQILRAALEVFAQRVPEEFFIIRVDEALPEADIRRNLAAVIPQRLDPTITVEDFAGLDVPIPRTVTHAIQRKPKTGFGVFNQLRGICCDTIRHCGLP
mgnify:CR=1 FL=1